ncbi:cellulose biosynthesis regulator YedQ [Cupriavidus metallidurans]|uniref:cellulose biosynthesis regulator YedQ n=1 Tax=Cupriavidus metallidurans TaxID=119219 RepID=UPI001CCAEF0B|nr:cellulose biosynthesis regulator YedQ [Cupriavidus metallidurans]UBM09628.1 cellulose biosynthesis regulator YedQ [Cupriavidus metallidurans]
MHSASDTGQLVPSDRFLSRLWLALIRRPRRFILIAFSAAILLILLLIFRGMMLSRDAEIESVRQMQAVRAVSINALLQLEAERLTNIRNYAEHLMQIQDELPALFAHDIQTAFEHRNDDVWALRTRDAAPVFGVSAAQLTGLDGFLRDDAKLIPSMAVAIALSHMFSAGHNEPGLRERIAYVSGNGIIVAYPAIREQDVNPTLRSLASAAYFRNNLPLANPTRKQQWSIARSMDDIGESSLFLSAPVYAGNAFKAVLILEIPRHSLDESLNVAPHHDVNNYLVDHNGALMGASMRNVHRGETLASVLINKWPADKLAVAFRSDAGILSNEHGSRLIYRKLGNSGLIMVDEVSTRELLQASVARLSGAIGAGAVALGLLLCFTLAIVHTLFGHYIARGEALRTLAETDALTGLANRRVFASRFADAYAWCKRDAVPVSLIMLDIDRFKKINDRWGHASGDVVLRTLADALRANVRNVDLPARLGGEEFAVLLPRTGIADAANLAEKLRLALQALVCEPVDSDDTASIRFTASFGVAQIAPDEPGNLDSLLMVADQRLYAAKAGGRNKVVWDEPQPEEMANEKPVKGT